MSTFFRLAVRSGALFLCVLALAHVARGEIATQAASIAANSPSFELALQYENGEGVARDYARAVQLYCDAANHGDARAFLNLGWMYANGRGVARDDGIAVGWWRKAAVSDAPQAAHLLLMLSDVTPALELGCAPPPPPLLSPDQASPKVRALVRRFAASTGLNARLVLAVIAVESAFDAHAVSQRNAMGLMQLTAETAVRYGVRDPFDPEQNIRGGTTYLRWLLQRFGGDLTLALAAYNAGEATVDFYGGVPPFTETIDYIKRIGRFYPIDAVGDVR
jgi:soluble lytic murein transglycosylase-like protein